MEVDPKRVLAYLTASPRRAPQLSDPQVMGPRDDAYAAAVVAKICDRVSMEPSEFWVALLTDDIGRYDNEAVAMLSLSLGARDCARLIQGSNPIWYRKMPEDQPRELGDLRGAALSWGAHISHDLKLSNPITRKGTRIVNADFTSTRFKGSFDFCLTSPPYLNRLDYVVAHLPELSVLKHIGAY